MIYVWHLPRALSQMEREIDSWNSAFGHTRREVAITSHFSSYFFFAKCDGSPGLVSLYVRISHQRIFLVSE
jgi:hypothetical protein